MKTRVRKRGKSGRLADDVKLRETSAGATRELDALVAQITEHNRHDEVDAGARAGNEVW